MKRFVFILFSLSALFVLSFTSCGDTITEIQQVQPNTRTLRYTVAVRDWSRGSDEVGPYLFREFREPALTSNIFNNGTMVAYMWIVGRLTPLPFSDFWVTNTGIQYEEQVTCEFEPGFVTFIFKADDQILAPNFDYSFQVKLMW